MEKCKWCGNHYKAGLFSSGFCSKKCEIEGGAKGVKKTSPFIGIILIIVIFYFALERNSEKKQEPKENTIEENYTSPKENSNAINSETYISPESSKDKEENNLQNENSHGNLSDELSNDNTSNQELNENNEATKSQEEIVINLLKNGKSIKEVSNLTGLSRHEVRVIRRKIK